MKASEFPDPFKTARTTDGVLQMTDHGESVHMVLRMDDLRACAKNWETFSSGTAIPGRIVVPSEEDIREVRQIPVETDPPVHAAFRKLLDVWFKRPLDKAYQEVLEKMIDELLDEVLQMDRLEVVSDFALKLQSHALTLLLNVPCEEATTWISWGTHVFRSEATSLDKDKSAVLDDYIARQIDQAIKTPGKDIYSQLLAAEVDGRKLTREEVHGISNLTFAGGRDTVINVITNTFAYLAENPQHLEQLHQSPRMAALAVEELVRYFAPLTHLGRISTKQTTVCEHAIQQDQKISLCWAAANRDESVFDHPDEVQLDRRQNPHVGFGFGHHKCLGATHARQVIRLMLTQLANKVKSIEILDYQENHEGLGDISRKVGFDELNVRLIRR
ncbi:MAG: cytochrome P450 [Cytophagales bacterium]|nr:cytochrome P450 [Cytophagales bacterium]